MAMFKWHQRPTRARPSTRAQNGPRPIILELETLEDRTLPSASLGVVFNAGTGALPELELLSCSWGASGAPQSQGAGGPALQDFTLAFAPSMVEPGLWGHLVGGSRLSSAAIHVRPPNNGVNTDYLTYTLSNVLVSSFQTNETGGTAPVDTVQLHFDRITEFSNTTGNGAQYDQTASQGGFAGSLAGSGLPAPAALGLSLVDGGVSEPELAIASYSWLATATAGLPDLAEFIVTLAPGSVEPGLWGHLAAGSTLDSASIHVRRLVAGVETDYVTYNLAHVKISSFGTSDSSGGAPQDTVHLRFGQVTETYSPADSTGAVGTGNTARYDQAAGITADAGSLTGPALSAPPQVGLTLVENSVAEPELAVVSYSWVATSTGMGAPTLADFTLTLAPTSVEPALWGHLTAGTSLTSAVIQVRQQGIDNVQTEYISFDLSQVLISSFETSGETGAAPQDTIHLSFQQVTESFSPPDGNSEAADSAQYDRAGNVSGDSGSLAGPALPANPQVGLTLVDNNITEPELAVQSYAWDAAAPNTMSAFTASLAPTSVEPALWGHLAAGIHLSSAVIHVRLSDLQTEYVTYTLSDVIISSFQTNEENGAEPEDVIELDFGQINESCSQVTKNGLGTAITAEYDRAHGITGDAGSLAGPALSNTPLLGLSFAENGSTLPELAVLDYSWGGTNSTTGAVSLDDFTVALAASSVEPALWGHLTAGVHLDSATIHVRQLSQGVLSEYFTYTLTGVTLTSFQGRGDYSDGPQDTITLSYQQVAESCAASGTQGSANSARYNVMTSTSGAAGSLSGPALTATPQVGLTFTDSHGTTAEIEVHSYLWSAAKPAQGQASVQDFRLELAPTSVEPGLWGHLAAGSQLTSAAIHVREPVQNSAVEYLTFTLTGVTISNFDTAETAGQSPVDVIDLHIGQVSESYSPDPKDSLGSPNTAQYNVARGTSTSAGSLLGTPDPAFTSISSSLFNVGSAGSFTVTAVGLPSPTLSKDSGDTLPQGVTFNAASGLLSGTPSAGTGGTYTLHLMARNSTGNDASQTFTLTVNQPAAFTSANHATFRVAKPASFNVTATGFPLPLLFEDGGDKLPGGITFDPATGILGGTPAGGTAGTYTLHFTAYAFVNLVSQTFTLTVSAPPPARLSVSGTPARITAGETFTIMVSALDSTSHTDPYYLGVIHFTSTDHHAILPPDYPFVIADHGNHIFPITLTTAGKQTITVNDSAAPKARGSSSIAVSPASLHALNLAAGPPAKVYSGFAHAFTVTAVDAFNNIVTNYQGTVSFSSESKAILPVAYTFVLSDKGVHTFKIKFATPGKQGLTASDKIARVQVQLYVEVIAFSAGTASSRSTRLVPFYSEG